MDIEAILPFQILAVLLGSVAAGARHAPTTPRHLLIFLALGVCLFGQPMVLIRTFDKPTGSRRRTYFIMNQAYLIGSVVVIMGIASLYH